MRVKNVSANVRGTAPGLKKCTAAWSVGSRMVWTKSPAMECVTTPRAGRTLVVDPDRLRAQVPVWPLRLDDSDGGEIVNMWKRILVAAVISWAYSVTLGLLFAVAVSEDRSLRTLLLPAVVPVALIGSTIVAIAITPVAIWSMRTGARNLCFYGPILWIALAAYVVFAIPRAGHYGQYGLLFLAVLGAVILGFIPAR